MYQRLPHMVLVFIRRNGSTIPVECHVILKSLLHQEIVKKTAKVIVVGFVVERE